MLGSEHTGGSEAMGIYNYQPACDPPGPTRGLTHHVAGRHGPGGGLIVSSLTNRLSLDAVRRLSNAAKLTVTDLVLAAADMTLQMAAGFVLYPSLAGPIVLLVTSVIVLSGPGRDPGRWPGSQAT